MSSSKTSGFKKTVFKNLKEDMMAPESSFYIEGGTSFVEEEEQTGDDTDNQSGILKILVIFLIAMMIAFLLIV